MFISIEVPLAAKPFKRLGGGKSVHRFTPKPLREYKAELLSFLVDVNEYVDTYPISVNIHFSYTDEYTKKNSIRRSDLDNLVKPVLDALQYANIIKQDNTKHINRLTLSIDHSATCNKIDIFIYTPYEFNKDTSRSVKHKR